MRKSKMLSTIILTTVFLLSTVFSNVQAQSPIFTPEEQGYIKEHETIVVMAYAEEGNMPIQYLDVNGELKGIAIEVLKQIEAITGFNFKINTCEVYECAVDKKGDLFVPVSNKYNVTAVIPSVPFASVTSSVFMNKHQPLTKPEDFEGKRYAEIMTKRLDDFPVDVEMVSYNTRKETIEAVHRGKADFGIGNDFSITHYTATGKYDNIITMPIQGSNSDYGLGFINQDETFMQIINKAIESISDEEIQSIVFRLIYEDINTGVFTQFLNEYLEIVISLLAVLSVIFLYLIGKLNKARRRIYKENEHYTILAKNSGELLFEYTFLTNDIQYWGVNKLRENEFNAEVIRYQIIGEIKKYLTLEEQIIQLLNKEGHPVHIRIRKSVIYDRKENPLSIFGSMKDVSEEQEYVEQLKIQSRTDGLTNLANSRYLKEQIAKRLKIKQPLVKDAFILFDLDNFKAVNDTYGHLRGDEILIKSAKIIESAFEDAYIIARFGGDEFCVYVKNVTDEQEIKDKALFVIHKIKDVSLKVAIGITSGITFVKEQENFDVIFKEADDALYLGKKRGRECMVIYPKDLKQL
ncbi:MAG TPA: GGDEF domain-containing protein [Erysipelothrix sp.]|nr:GGDEF domain-containing protein [Erysipelothrix sp.]